MQYLLANLSELAERKAKNIREEAQMWDVLSRDLKRAQKEQESLPPPTHSKVPPLEDVPVLNDRLYVRIKEAQKIMGMCRTALYNEIKESRLRTYKQDSLMV